MKEIVKIFGVSKSGYYAWFNRMKKKDARKEAEEKEEKELMGMFREIVKKLGYIPGKRTFRNFLFRDYQKQVSVRRCQRIMRKMNLVANRPHKDAYKGRATHNHRCTAPENEVKQDFYIGPRQVILTDITYLYYGISRSLFYFCAFKDAYTTEILGCASSTQMDTGLVKLAYQQMMEKHGKELKKETSVYIHSDQGSQYLSTTFRELLENDGFIQSASRRGNSQDNAPMESFFGQMKCRILDLVALCPDFQTASSLVENYARDYNDRIYQHKLAGLTPSEYYAYVTNGIYPCDTYFGIEATELLPIGELVAARLEAARKKEEKVRERNKAKREAAEEFASAPTLIVTRDQGRLEREKTKWKKSKKLAEKQIAHIDSILEKTREALSFLAMAPKEIIEELKYPQNWKKYKELDYVNEMNGLF